MGGFLQYSTLGIELAVSVVMFALIGYFADGHFGSKPWLMVFGVVLGASVGMWNIYKISVGRMK